MLPFSHFQLEVEARRQFEVTEQVAKAMVNITVTRNEYPPQFSKGEFRREALSEKTPVGSSILRVNATDRDGVRLDWLLSSYIIII